jgi:hypothetical protein
MLRFYFPLVFVALYAGWLLYRLLIKKDLRKHLDTVYLGLFFMGIWALIYWWFTNVG